ncbi:PadR family transcriptional regulator [Massilia phyllosphaerae]|uniref:PadR family transcriptional regulator n=1 Tax=Massilia phyllosphaerae TaxID=3106034 RepID=UPI002B1CBE72|nr:PadR family transcriptional regulator [Massilia sp. SGZ-792]
MPRHDHHHPHHHHEHHGHEHGHDYGQHEYHAAPDGPHRGPRGHGPGPRGGRGGGFGFDEGGPRGRKLSSDDLQLLLLALIGEQPSHGYELIKALEQRSSGFYVPSPGMMYPALSCMEDRGHVSIQAEGNRKRYALSDDGRTHLEANREHVDGLLAKLDAAAEKMRVMRSALAEGGEDAGGKRWTAELADARHALKHALEARAHSPAEEQQRIAAILARAKAEIESVPAAAQQ